jgi:DNA polymerase V
MVSGRGGDRDGAGRPKNPEKSKTVYVPVSLAEALQPKIETYRRKLKAINKNAALSEEERKKAIDDLGLCGSWMFPQGSKPSTLKLPCFPVAATPGADGFAHEAIFVDGDKNDNDMEVLSSLVDDPDSTFLVKVSGDSMKGVNINDGDILVVEKWYTNRTIKEGQVVIASFSSGSQVVKLFHRISSKKIQLISANQSSDYPPISISGDSQDILKIDGIVKHYGVAQQWITQTNDKPFPTFNLKQWL